MAHRIALEYSLLHMEIHLVAGASTPSTLYKEVPINGALHCRASIINGYKPSLEAEGRDNGVEAAVCQAVNWFVETRLPQLPAPYRVGFVKIIREEGAERSTPYDPSSEILTLLYDNRLCIAFGGGSSEWDARFVEQVMQRKRPDLKRLLDSIKAPCNTAALSLPTPSVSTIETPDIPELHLSEDHSADDNDSLFGDGDLERTNEVSDRVELSLPSPATSLSPFSAGGILSAVHSDLDMIVPAPAVRAQTLDARFLDDVQGTSLPCHPPSRTRQIVFIDLTQDDDEDAAPQLLAPDRRRAHAPAAARGAFMARITQKLQETPGANWLSATPRPTIPVKLKTKNPKPQGNRKPRGNKQPRRLPKQTNDENASIAAVPVVSTTARDERSALGPQEQNVDTAVVTRKSETSSKRRIEDADPSPSSASVNRDGVGWGHSQATRQDKLDEVAPASSSTFHSSKRMKTKQTDVAAPPAQFVSGYVPPIIATLGPSVLGPIIISEQAPPSTSVLKLPANSRQGQLRTRTG